MFTCVGLIKLTAAHRSARVFLLTAAFALLTALLAVAPASGAARATTYRDPAGDAAIAGVDLTTVTISNDHHGTLTIWFALTPPVAGHYGLDLLIEIDADRNRTTGDKTGVDYQIDASAGYGGPETKAPLRRWTGKGQTGFQDIKNLKESLDSTGGTVPLSNRDIGGTFAFDFSMEVVGCCPVAWSDQAPDSGFWTYKLRAPAITSVKVASAPQNPAAGRLFSVRVVGLTLTDPVETVRPESVKCSATLGGTSLRGTGAGGCSFRIPPTATGKKLVLKLTATYEGSTKAKSVTYTVRRA